MRSPTCCLLLTTIAGRSQVFMNLSSTDPLSLRLWRAAQQETNVALRFRAAPASAPKIAEQLLAQSRTKSSSWKYTFATLQEVHTFQKSLTGADVLFDRIASSFLVTRGNGLRTKKEEFGATRLQLFHDGSKQLWQVHAYFEDGQTLNFALDTNDVFERSNSKSNFSIRLVEVKITLPAAKDDDEKRGFLCVEEVDDGIERDDITITFDEHEYVDQLAKVLPASVKKTSSLMDALHFR